MLSLKDSKPGQPLLLHDEPIYLGDKIIGRTTSGNYSFNYKKTNLKSYWSKKYNLGICGDWFMGPKIEHAWLSANNLFKKIDKKKPALKKRV